LLQTHQHLLNLVELELAELVALASQLVVLAAGNSPVLTANPFEAVSTVTVSIVNQLTGDQDFSSAQSLVAFALGLTLFVMTLVLNVVALVVVRRYREQYE